MMDSVRSGRPALIILLLFSLMSILSVRQLKSAEIVHLTLDSAVDIAMGSSYRIKQLEMGIERTRFFLKSRQASLKSRVYMNLQAPEIEAVSETKWNSTLQKDEIVHSNTSRWQMDLSVRQPVLLFGYPTNGYLSLNNKIYRYLQENEGNEVDYYNRYYIKFEQPFFLPNNLKNNIEDAELDLERSELSYIVDRVGLVDEVADDYYDMFEVVYKGDIYNNQVRNLERLLEIVEENAAKDGNRTIEVAQVKVELANARENLLRNQGQIRQEAARIKQRLQMPLEDSVIVEPLVIINRMEINPEQAVEYGYNLSPRLRRLSIDKRKNEIDLNNSKGWDAFHVNLEMTYGLEKQKDEISKIWNEYDGSYSVSLNAYVPIWDWGRRKAQIEAYEISVRSTELYIEETRNNIRSNIINAVANLNEYQSRALNMKESADLVQDISDQGLAQYRSGAISLQDAFQMINRQRETELNFLDAYLGYRRSLISLMIQTYYDYENGISLLEKFSSGKTE